MTIKVHVLNFHGIFSHIEIVLENMDSKPHQFYGINRWEEPGVGWSLHRYKSYIDQADSVFSFEIEACSEEIVRRWTQYWLETYDDASVIGKNCAVAAQWFLHEFAGIAAPSIQNVSWNHIVLGILWPSFIPCPINLPGRIMSNVEFYIHARNNQVAGQQYSKLFLYTSMAMFALSFTGATLGLALGISILTGGLATVGFIALATASCYGFFKAHNALSAKDIYEKTQVSSQHQDYEVSLVSEQLKFL